MFWCYAQLERAVRDTMKEKLAMKRDLLFLISILLLSATLFSYSEEYGYLIGTITEKGSGEPIPARIYITGSDKKLYPGENCITWGTQGFAKRVGSSGQHSVTMDNMFKSKLPVGKAEIIVERGKEYIPLKRMVDIEKNDTIRVNFELERWIDMASKGWYSGDNHVHRKLDDIKYLMLADDLNFSSVQTYWNRHPEGDSKTFVDNFLKNVNAQGVVEVDENHQFSAISHEIEGRPGAVLFHLTDKANSPLPGIEKKDFSPEYILLAERTHNFGGYVSIEKPFWPESPVQLILSDPDFTQVANNHHCHQGYLPEHIYSRTEFKQGYPDGELGYTLFICDLYYAFLNCGSKIMASAGSASGVLPNPVGYNRAYVKIEGEPTYEKWLTALKSGHNFVTNGPMLIITANGKRMGETITLSKLDNVEINIEIESIVPISRLELIQDGDVVQTVRDIDFSNHSYTKTLQIPFKTSGWLAVRCFEEREDNNTRFAHTSPIFVMVAEKPIKPKRPAVEWFLQRIDILTDHALKKKDEDATKKTEWEAKLQLYEQARQIYEKMLAESI